MHYYCFIGNTRSDKRVASVAKVFLCDAACDPHWMGFKTHLNRICIWSGARHAVKACTQGSFHYSPVASDSPWHQASWTFLTLIWTFSPSSVQDSLPASLLHSPDRSGQAFRHCLPYNHRLHIIALNPIIIWKYGLFICPFIFSRCHFKTRLTSLNVRFQGNEHGLHFPWRKGRLKIRRRNMSPKPR